MRIKTGIFDLGKVMLNYHWPIALELLERQYGVDPHRLAGTMLHSDTHEGLEGDLYRGRLTPNEFYRASLALLRRGGAASGQESLLDYLTEERFWDILNSIFLPNPPMEKLIRRLKRRGLRLVLCTNTCAPHLDFVMRAFRILDNFDAVVASHRVRASKPNPRIYHRALRAAEADPRECFFIDDLPRNLPYPHALGIETFLYNLEQHELFLDWLADKSIL